MDPYRVDADMIGSKSTFHWSTTVWAVNDAEAAAKGNTIAQSAAGDLDAEMVPGSLATTKATREPTGRPA